MFTKDEFKTVCGEEVRLVRHLATELQDVPSDWSPGASTTSAPARRRVRAARGLHAALAVFSLVWLVGHATVRVLDWEFWFATLYTVTSAATWLLLRRADDARGP